MAQDFYIDPASNDWYLEDDTTIRMCDTYSELIRQQLYITLSTFQGEWFANTTFGTPYFQSIYGKNNQGATDTIIKNKIRSVDGVDSIVSFDSSTDKNTREYSCTFSVETTTGDIVEVTT